VSILQSAPATCRIEALESRRLLSSTIYVDVNSPGPTRDGTTWQHAYSTLPQALTASDAGDEIHIADGTYKPTTTTNRAVFIQLKDGVRIFGGYAGYGAANPDARDIAANVTILSGNIGSTASAADNSYHVIVASGTTPATLLDGVTVTAGNANGAGADQVYGAGLYEVGGSPTINQCTFTANSCSSGGAGMYSGAGSTPQLTGCTFLSNVSSVVGGGMYNIGASNPLLADCTFSFNTAQTRGGGMYNSGSSPTMLHCTFSDNSQFSSFGGGGIYNTASSNPSLTECTFTANHAISGGAIYNQNSSPNVLSCSFVGNTADSSSGGAILNEASSPTISQCSFIENTAAHGGAIYGYSSSHEAISDCLFMRNWSSYGDGGAFYTDASPFVANCRFLGNIATRNGGAIETDSHASATFVGCLMVGNTAFSGGAVVGFQSVSIKIINCTIVSNTAQEFGGLDLRTGNPSVGNCIIWGNSSGFGNPQIDTGMLSGRVTYCDVQGGVAGTGNIALDAQFVRSAARGPDNAWGTADDDYGDLHVHIASACIDAGNNALVPASITTDLDGNARFTDVPGAHDPGSIVDIGGYEYSLPLRASAGAFLFNQPRQTISISFDGDANAATVAPGDLLLTNLTTGQNIDCGALSTANYDAATRSGRWSFSSTVLPDGNYHAVLPAGTVADSFGTITPGDFAFDFFVLSADADRSQSVDTVDFNILATNFGQAGKTFSQGNFDYDAAGQVDSVDFNLLAANFSKTLPAPPEIAAAEWNPARATPPTSSPFGDAAIIELTEPSNSMAELI
jgi:predicted outer membrane repeat protein